MLANFSVSNFKSFNNSFQLNLENSNRYEFNKNSIKNDIINNSLVYGHNGVGKSNLGLAIFDITRHLTDFQKNEEIYSNYLNAENSSDYALFEYKFKFGDDIVEYSYKKSSDKILVYEILKINKIVVAEINRLESSKAILNLKGTESLNSNITNEKLSIVKYLKYNSVLEENHENDIFLKFYLFVEGMLFFRSLNRNMYIGLKNKNTSIQANIIDTGNVKDFERFLNKAGIKCKLSYSTQSNNKTIYFKG